MSDITNENGGLPDLSGDEAFKIEMFNKSVGILRDMKSADEIAEFFRNQGIKAVPGNASSCAISNYIKSQMTT